MRILTSPFVHVLTICLGAGLGFAVFSAGFVASDDGPVWSDIQVRMVRADDPAVVSLYEIRKNGSAFCVLRDWNSDGVLDYWEFFDHGESSLVIEDRNHDGQPDYWQLLTGERAGVVAFDDDFDGSVDREERYRVIQK